MYESENVSVDEKPEVAENGDELSYRGTQRQYDDHTLGTPEQTVIVNDYPMKTSEQKLKVPYIERFNGNLCVSKGDFDSAVMHYNKALVGLKMLF